MKVNVKQICDAIKMPFKVIGSQYKYINNVTSIKNSNTSSLIYCIDTTKLNNNIESPIIITPLNQQILISTYEKSTIIAVDNPRLAFIRVMKEFFNKGDISVKINIGNHTDIHESVEMANNGFSFETNDEGIHEMFPHIGGIVIGDDVYIGPYCVIDRGTLDDTIIGNGCKINSYVHVGHNAVIGENCVLHGRVFVAGSCIIGNNTIIGIGAIIRDGVSIGENCYIGMGSVVTKDVQYNSVVYGNPARRIRNNK